MEHIDLDRHRLLILVAPLVALPGCSDYQPGDSTAAARLANSSMLANEPTGLESEYGAGLIDDGDGPQSFCPPSTRASGASPTIPSNGDPLPILIEPLTAQERLLKLASERGSETLRFAVRLHDPMPVEDIVVASRAQREQILKERQSNLFEIQSFASSQIAALGGTIVGAQHLANGLIVEAAGKDAPAIVASPLVMEASIAEGTIVPGAVYDGLDQSNGTLSFLLNNAGYIGETGGRAGAQVRVAVFEGGDFNTHHVGWYDIPGGPKRIAKKFECSDSGCVVQPPPWPNVTYGHATVVTDIIGGSIEQGQDANFPGTDTLAQKRRSGLAREVQLYLFKTPTPCSLTHALWHAVNEGVDIANMSILVGCGGSVFGDKFSDCCSLNAQLDAARAYGVVTNACGGNDGPGGNPWYPATRSETIAVSSLDADNSLVEYDDLVVGGNQSGGPMAIRTFTGWNTSTPVIDLATPGGHGFTFSNSQSYISASGPACSWATPVATGAAALLRSTFTGLNWCSPGDSGALTANLLMMGDASSGTANGESNSAVHSRTGYGLPPSPWTA